MSNETTFLIVTGVVIVVLIICQTILNIKGK